MSKHNDQPSTDAEALVVQPGQTLLVRVAPYTEPEQAQQLRTELESRLPGVDVLVVACEQLAAYQPTG